MAKTKSKKKTPAKKNTKQTARKKARGTAKKSAKKPTKKKAVAAARKKIKSFVNKKVKSVATKKAKSPVRKKATRTTKKIKSVPKKIIAPEAVKQADIVHHVSLYDETHPQTIGGNKEYERHFENREDSAMKQENEKANSADGNHHGQNNN